MVSSLAELAAMFGRGVQGFATMGMSEWQRQQQLEEEAKKQSALKQYGDVLSGNYVPNFAKKELSPQQLQANQISALASINLPEAQKNASFLYDSTVDTPERQMARGQLAVNQGNLAVNQQEAATRKQAIERGGDIPATVKIANEIETAIKNGDTKRANLLMAIHKTLDRGVLAFGDNGNYAPAAIPNYAEATAGIEGAKAGAKKSAEGLAEIQTDLSKKAQNASTSNDVLSMVKQTLPEATGSGVGSKLAGGKAQLGISDKKTQADAKLRLYSGWLTSSVPRMEGPQGVADVEMYKKMAADVGNNALPVADRQAAVSGLEALNQKYAHLNKAASAEVSKTIGGKQYIQKDGKWFEK